MKKLLLLFVLILFCLDSYSQAKKKVTVTGWRKTDDNKLRVEYYVLYGSENATYELTVKFYDNKKIQLPAFAISGDFPKITGGAYKTLYWDVLKDRPAFPEISTVIIEIKSVTFSKTATTENQIKEPVIVKPYQETKIIEPVKTTQIDQSKVNTEPEQTPTKIKNTNKKEKTNNEFQFNLFAYEYDLKDKTSQYSILRMGGVGIMWTLIGVNQIRIDDRTVKNGMSYGSMLEFRVGGAIFKHLDFCLVGTGNLSGNSLTAENKDDKTKNIDKYKNTEYFYGLELRTHIDPNRGDKGAIGNLYVKAGVANSKGTLQRVKADYTYETKNTFGPGEYYTIAIGIKILDSSNDLLRLW